MARKFLLGLNIACTLLLGISTISCEKEYMTIVPNIDPFEFDVNLDNPKYQKLKNGSFSSVLVTNGCGSLSGLGVCGYNSHGILLFRYLEETEIYAYDATCSNDTACLKYGVVEQSSQYPANGVCRRCGSSYNLIDGKHTEKKLMLRRYGVMPIGSYTGQFRVSNKY